MVSHRLESVANYARSLAFVDKDQALFRVGSLGRDAPPGGPRRAVPAGRSRSARSGAAVVYPLASGEDHGDRAPGVPRRARDLASPARRLVLAGALLGALGVYVVLRRTVFVSAALTQLSTLGLVATLLAEERFHIETEHASEQLLVATAFSVVGALALGAFRRRLPAEATVGAAWVVSSALVVLGASQLVHAAHDLGGMVFGNAVAVPASDLAVIAVVAALCLAVHGLFARSSRSRRSMGRRRRRSGCA